MDLDGTGGDAVLTILMRDVGGFLVPPGDTVVPPGQHAGFVTHMATLAAAFWGWAEDRGLTTMTQRLRFFTPGTIATELTADQVPGPLATAAAGWPALAARSPLLSGLARAKEAVIARYRSELENHGIATSGWWQEQLDLCLIGIMATFGWEKALGDATELSWWEAAVAGAAARLHIPIPGAGQ